MKRASVCGLLALAQYASAHYRFTTLIAGSSQSRTAVRQPADSYPVEDLNSSMMTCNSPQASAADTVTVSPGSTVGFIADNLLYHQGPAAFYLAKAPADAASWNGAGEWIKIAEWGATFDPFKFVAEGKLQLTTTLPSVPDGEYLLRVEHIGLHITGAPQFYISCAQIKVVNGGGSLPSGVSIPGYLTASDPGLSINIWDPIPTSYTIPGPPVYRG